MDRWFRQPYTNYTEPVVERDGDVLNEWEVFWELASRLGSTLPLPGGSPDMSERPVTDEIIDLAYAGSRMPLDEVRASRRQVHPDMRPVVQPADDGRDRPVHAGTRRPDGRARRRCCTSRPPVLAGADVPALPVPPGEPPAEARAQLDRHRAARPRAEGHHQPRVHAPRRRRASSGSSPATSSRSRRRAASVRRRRRARRRRQARRHLDGALVGRDVAHRREGARHRHADQPARVGRRRPRSGDRAWSCRAPSRSRSESRGPASNGTATAAEES